MHGLDKEWKPSVTAEKVRFDAYPGYMTTVMGAMKGKEALDVIAKEILQ